MHGKFAIRDTKPVSTVSANFTRGGPDGLILRSTDAAEATSPP
jgi:hypothetical protein